jgi:hypothetical protein
VLALIAAAGLIALIARLARSGWHPFTTKRQGAVV